MCLAYCILETDGTFLLKPLDLGHLEAQLGLIIRDKDNHDNYALINFEDFEKLIEYYYSFKDKMELDTGCLK